MLVMGLSSGQSIDIGTFMYLISYIHISNIYIEVYMYTYIYVYIYKVRSPDICQLSWPNTIIVFSIAMIVCVIVFLFLLYGNRLNFLFSH